MLGTGTPIPTPNRSGPATAIVVNGKAYIVDFGPGVVRRAAEVSKEYGGPLNALNVDQLGIAFLTHLHHDHSAGLPDLVYTSWTHGRENAFELYGPPGTAAMASNVAEDLDIYE
jgi:ribonuclease Z